MFFVMLGVLLFVKSLKSEKKLPYFLSGVFLGLGILTKVYALLFAPALVFYAFYYNDNKMHKKQVQGQKVKHKLE